MYCGRAGWLDLAPQPEHLHVDRAIVNLRAVQPREIEQLLARQHPLRRCAERVQQVNSPWVSSTGCRQAR